MSEIRRYKKIASAFGRTKLYAGKDHLLHVTGIFVQSSRRFYYRDLLGATAIRNVGNTIAGWLIILFLCGIGGPMLYVGWNSPDDVGGVLTGFGLFFFIPGVIFFFAQLTTELKGGSCTFYLDTAVQHTLIPAVNNMSKARNVCQLIERRASLRPTEAPATDPGSAQT